MSSNDDNDSLLGGTPVTWVVIPLLGVIVFAATLTVLLIRRRRRNRLIYGSSSYNSNGTQRWPGAGAYYGNGTHVHQHSRGGGRWAPWGAARSQDGLNELGEAPPPYMGKKGAAGQGDVELGTPPDYHVAGPAPAVTTDSRRH